MSAKALAAAAVEASEASEASEAAEAAEAEAPFDEAPFGLAVGDWPSPVERTSI